MGTTVLTDHSDHMCPRMRGDMPGAATAIDREAGQAIGGGW